MYRAVAAGTPIIPTSTDLTWHVVVCVRSCVQDRQRGNVLHCCRYLYEMYVQCATYFQIRYEYIVCMHSLAIGIYTYPTYRHLKWSRSERAPRIIRASTLRPVDWRPATTLLARRQNTAHFRIYRAEVAPFPAEPPVGISAKKRSSLHIPLLSKLGDLQWVTRGAVVAGRAHDDRERREQGSRRTVCS